MKSSVFGTFWAEICAFGRVLEGNSERQSTQVTTVSLCDIIHTQDSNAEGMNMLRITMAQARSRMWIKLWISAVEKLDVAGENCGEEAVILVRNRPLVSRADLNP